MKIFISNTNVFAVLHITQFVTLYFLLCNDHFNCCVIAIISYKQKYQVLWISKSVRPLRPLEMQRQTWVFFLTFLCLLIVHFIALHRRLLSPDFHLSSKMITQDARGTRFRWQPYHLMSTHCFSRGILAWDSVLLEGQIIPTLEMTLAYLLRRLYRVVLQQRMADSGKALKHKNYLESKSATSIRHVYTFAE